MMLRETITAIVEPDYELTYAAHVSQEDGRAM